MLQRDRFIRMKRFLRSDRLHGRRGHGGIHRLATTLAVLVATLLPPVTSVRAAIPWQDARQMVVVTTPDWDASSGELRRFTHDGAGWIQTGRTQAVQVGRSGSAWGSGLHPHQAGTRKREGDGRSPAGIFQLGKAFGYAPNISTALEYQAMQASDYCIDVPDSPLYNRIVDANDVGEVAVEGSTEPMRRDIHLDGDQRYALGFVIRHNPLDSPSGGSCIFAHVWKAADVPTAGCTAMPGPVMRTLLDWLRPEAAPVFVLLPAPVYGNLQAPWHLPAVVTSVPAAGEGSP